MTPLRSLVCTLLVLYAATADACRTPPEKLLIPPEEQLRQTLDVAIGQVISATPLNDYQVEYRFLTLEQLAGTAQKVFTVMGGPAGFDNKDTSFNDHADFSFWARGGGRTMNGSDCAMHPGFVVGNSYLVFLGSMPTWRSYEKIEMVDGRPNPDDKWLVYVKQMLSGRAVVRDGTPDYERVGRFIYGFHRILSLNDLDRKTLAAQHAPAELLLRVGRLADEFDRIVQHSAAMSDLQLDLTLREAEAVNAALAAWRDSSTR
jgi:hypothetical protein